MSSPTKDELPGKILGASSVILCDSNLHRQQLMSRIIESCAARPNQIKPGEVSRVERSCNQAIVLVALGGVSADAPASFEVIKNLKLKGFKLICYGDDVFSWPIGIRCRALLSGASLLIDSASKTLDREMRQVLVKALETEAKEYLEERRIKAQMKELGIIGESLPMLSVFRWVFRVSALSDFPVLIKGETGTGKELIANAVHRLDGRRCKGPFVAANCGAISSGVAESEFFGHRRGAFTGADSDRKGLFRSAEGGVLFLDEISELSQSLQAKLLRVLQAERVLGVGFDREVSINVRVIAATNRSLESMVKERTFREDLYHRLNVLSVNIPPLRERFEDLQPLTTHFLEKYSAPGQSPRSVSAEFLEAFRQMNLSGNARQLENIIRRAVSTNESDTPLGLSDLTTEEWEQLSDNIDIDLASTAARDKSNSLTREHDADRKDYFLNILDSNGWNLTKSLAYCERAFLECALQIAQGNQSETARLVGITPRSVYNKVHKHKLV